MIEASNDIMGLFDFRTLDEALGEGMEAAVEEFVAAGEKEEIQISEDEPDVPEETGIEAEEENYEEPEKDPKPQMEGEQRDEYYFWLEMQDGTKDIRYVYPVENLDICMDALNAYRAALPEDGELHFLQIPYGRLANMVPDNSIYVGWDCDADEYMASKADPGVYIHRSTEILSEPLLNGEPMFFRTDHHWAPLGAFYALSGMMDDQGIPHLEYNDYDFKVHTNFLGSAYKGNTSPEIKKLAERLEVPYMQFPVKFYDVWEYTEQQEIPFLIYNRSSYTAFLGGDAKLWRKAETGANTGRKVLIVNDSFSNCLIPFLAVHYDEIHNIDLRENHYSFNKVVGSVRDYIEYFGIDDVYIMMATSSSMNSRYMLEFLMKYLDE